MLKNTFFANLNEDIHTTHQQRIIWNLTYLEFNFNFVVIGTGFVWKQE